MMQRREGLAVAKGGGISTRLFPGLSETECVKAPGLFDVLRFVVNEIMLAMNEVGSKRTYPNCEILKLFRLYTAGFSMNQI